MASSVQSPADVVNLALVRIGHTWRVGNLYDGSRAAKVALDAYGQTRDELLRDQDYGFSERTLTLALLKSAPAGGYVPPVGWNPATNPPIPWLYEYGYPADALKIRAVRSTPPFLPDFDPKPNVFETPNDNSLNPPAKVIVCNVAQAIAVYTGRVTDPTTMEAAFIEAWAAALGRRLAPALAGLDAAKIEAADEQVETAAAVIARG